MNPPEFLAPAFCIGCGKRVTMTLAEEFVERMAFVFGEGNVASPDDPRVKEQLGSTPAKRLCDMMHKAKPLTEP